MNNLNNLNFTNNNQAAATPAANNNTPKVAKKIQIHIYINRRRNSRDKALSANWWL